MSVCLFVLVAHGVLRVHLQMADQPIEPEKPAAPPPQSTPKHIPDDRPSTIDELLAQHLVFVCRHTKCALAPESSRPNSSGASLRFVNLMASPALASFGSLKAAGTGAAAAPALTMCQDFEKHAREGYHCYICGLSHCPASEDGSRPNLVI